MEYSGIKFETKPGTFEDGKPCIEARLKERPNSVYTGDTEHEAIEWMLLGVAQLAYERNLIPGAPGICGNPDPIQCAMSLLETALRYAIREREQLCLISQDDKESLEKRAPERGRLSELIGNLGTAISSLARVKHD